MGSTWSRAWAMLALQSKKAPRRHLETAGLPFFKLGTKKAATDPKRALVKAARKQARRSK
jgi:hypothetical protein